MTVVVETWDAWPLTWVQNLPRSKENDRNLSVRCRHNIQYSIPNYQLFLVIVSTRSFVSTLEISLIHYSDIIMGARASQITSLTIVYSTVYSDADQRKHQSSASLAFVWGIHRGPVNSPHKWPVTRKMFPFDDVIMLPLFSSVFVSSAGAQYVFPLSTKTYIVFSIPRADGLIPLSTSTSHILLLLLDPIDNKPSLVQLMAWWLYHDEVTCSQMWRGIIIA